MHPITVLNELCAIWPIRTRPTLIVISGGEPMLQQTQLAPLLEQLDMYGNQMHIETAGTLSPNLGFDKYVTQYNVSPKLQHSGNPGTLRYRPRVLKDLNGTGKARFKFVARAKSDLDEVRRIVKEIEIDSSNVMIMPEGTTAENNAQVARDIANAALHEGWGISMRLHVLLWPNDKDM